MKSDLKVMDCDLHVIEQGDVYQQHLAPAFRDRMPQYLGWGPTNFPHWRVAGQLIPPWADDAAVVGPQRFLDAPTRNGLPRPARAATTPPAPWAPWTRRASTRR